MGTAALKQTELDPADFRAGMLLYDIGQMTGETTKLRMAETVSGRGLRLGDETAVGVMDALGYGNEYLAVISLAHLVNIGKEFIHVKVSLGEIDQIRAGSIHCGQNGTGGKPSGVTAHDLHDGYHRGIVNAGILVDLHAGGRDILCRTGKTGAVVSAVQIVVDRFGNTHHAALIADGFHVTADLVAGIHRVVAAIIEEIADVILFENFQDALVIGVIGFGIGNLIAAGTKLGRRGVKKQLKLFRVLFIHNIQLVLEDALDAMSGAVNFCDLLRIQSRADHAVGTGVDNGSGAARLSENARTD